MCKTEVEITTAFQGSADSGISLSEDGFEKGETASGTYSSSSQADEAGRPPKNSGLTALTPNSA